LPLSHRWWQRGAGSGLALAARRRARTQRPVPRRLHVAPRRLAWPALARGRGLRAACRRVRRLCRGARAAAAAGGTGDHRDRADAAGAVPGQPQLGLRPVLPFAPAHAYGTPGELQALVDEAHGLGLMVLLDVVYNHFGPDGNYLGSYASSFFRAGSHTPWGEAIDFGQPAVQGYFIANALMWLEEYRFDGLRLDAVHAIEPTAFLHQLREAVHAALPADRHVHLVLENEHNQASLLRGDFTAQWDDYFHNALHVLLTGEDEGYYGACAPQAAAHLARVLGEGF